MNHWDLVTTEQKKHALEKLSPYSTSYLKDVWRRFTVRKSSLVGLLIIVIMILLAIFAPMVSKHSYDSQTRYFANIAPFFTAYQVGDQYYYVNNNFKLVEVSKQGSLLQEGPKGEENARKKTMTYEINGNTYQVNYKKTPLALADADGNPLPSKNLFNKDYIFGTDNLGRDLWVRIQYGARISLTVAFVAALVNLIIGILYGSISAYIGGNVDMLMMRVVDIIDTIPLTLYVILIMVIFQNSGLMSIIIAIGSVYWVSMARIVRSQIFYLKEQEYVYAAKTMGSSTWYILTKHLIPNAMGPIVVTVTMLIPTAIFTEAFMSFIGLGVSAPMSSWGTMCNNALEVYTSYPYQLFFPSVAICLAMFAFNFLGDGLRDALDPKSKK